MKTIDKAIRMCDSISVNDFYEAMNNGGKTRKYNYEACKKAAEQIPKYSKMSPTVQKYWDNCEEAYRNYVSFLDEVKQLAREAESVWMQSDRGADQKILDKSKFGKSRYADSHWYWEIISKGPDSNELSFAKEYSRKCYEKAKEAYEKLKRG